MDVSEAPVEQVAITNLFEAFRHYMVGDLREKFDALSTDVAQLQAEIIQHNINIIKPQIEELIDDKLSNYDPTDSHKFTREVESIFEHLDIEGPVKEALNNIRVRITYDD